MKGAKVAGKQPTGDEAKNETAAAEGLAGRLPPGAKAPAVVFLASNAVALVPGPRLAVTAGNRANITA